MVLLLKVIVLYFAGLKHTLVLHIQIVPFNLDEAVVQRKTTVIMRTGNKKSDDEAAVFSLTGVIKVTICR